MNAPELYARIEALSQVWPSLEINLGDLEWLVHRLATDLSVTLPDTFPSRDEGVELVELVESTLLSQSPQQVVRLNSPAALAQHCQDITQELRAKNLLSYDDATALVAALFAWLGCIAMAKTLRDVDSQGKPYTDDTRRREYARIERQWAEPGGPWIRYGVTLARALELGRGNNNPIEDWVPKDSPYWS